jgi:hypothetical protein
VLSEQPVDSTVTVVFANSACTQAAASVIYYFLLFAHTHTHTALGLKEAVPFLGKWLYVLPHYCITNKTSESSRERIEFIIILNLPKKEREREKGRGKRQMFQQRMGGSVFLLLCDSEWKFSAGNLENFIHHSHFTIRIRLDDCF